jgi:GAF domain-containing protein
MRFPIRDSAFQQDRARRARGEMVQARVSDLPSEQREWLTMEGVKSYMRVPIMADGAWWGTVGFDDCVEERSWQPLDAETLRATAGLIGVAIAHDQTVSALRDSERRFRGILDSALTRSSPVTIRASSSGSTPRPKRCSASRATT